MEYLVFENPSELADRLVKTIDELSSATLEKEQKYTVALSGGSTPSVLFKHLAMRIPENLKRKNIHFFWVDERCVPPDDEQSNFGVANNLLFDKLNIPPSRIHRIRGENEAGEEAARYSDEITANVKYINGLPAFDLILLGMGDDGHTASIFPGNLQLLHSEKVCEVATHPSSGQKRITLTGKVINNAADVIFMVTGKGKAGVLSEIFSGNRAALNYPAAHIMPGSGKLLWMLDTEAAYILKDKGRHIF